MMSKKIIGTIVTSAALTAARTVFRTRQKKHLKSLPGMAAKVLHSRSEIILIPMMISVTLHGSVRYVFSKNCLKV